LRERLRSKACNYGMYKYFQGKHVLFRHHTTLVGDNGGLSVRKSSSTASSWMIKHLQHHRKEGMVGFKTPTSNSNSNVSRSLHVVASQQLVWNMSNSKVSHQQQQQPSQHGNNVTVHQRSFIQMGMTPYNWTKVTSGSINTGCRYNNNYQNGGRWGDRDVDDGRSKRNLSKDTMGLGITVTRKKGKDTGYCYGCGADLVKEGAAGEAKTAPKKKGFWADQKDFLKKAQIKNWALCPRCKQLKKMEEGDIHIDEDMSKLLGPNHQMTEVFREEVGTIRKNQKAVVVMCVDAINVSGTLIRTIRNYVGGNPILLAITRCDLLPDYVYEDKNIEQLKDYYFRRCADVQPAAVYLCSEDKDKMQEVGGIKELASDMWEHLNGRDPYVIGAANIGKSTLTDILIAGFINRGTRMGHFRDRLALKRVEKLREARITKSALPGTTLQNIRVPCFVDHQHALWDTPGLLLDESTAHFPIRNFREIRSQRPNQIIPHIYAVPKKSFCLLITEKDDEFPLLRVEIRLKKDENASDSNEDSPVHVIWNSTLDLDTHIDEIKDAHLAEQDRFKRFILDAAPTPEEIAQNQKRLEEQQEDDRQQHRPRTEEEKKRRKEEKRLAYLARVKAEQEELGKEEWHRREEERKRKFYDEHRSKVLAKLVEVNQTVVDYEVGMDVAIANFGWIGFACSRTAMIKVYAPNSGVRVVCTPTIALPSNVGHYRTPPAPEKVEKQIKKKKKMGDDEYGMDDEYDDDDDDMTYDDIDMGDDPYGQFADHGMDYGGGYEYSGYDGSDDFGFASDSMHDEMNDDAVGGKKRRWYNPEAFKIDKVNESDPWAKFSGAYVGWQFDDDMRFSKRKDLVEGWVSLFLLISETRFRFYIVFKFTHPHFSYIAESNAPSRSHNGKERG
jgi:ribosome biogenesis GTPase A